ncbi:hypothetical protein D3C75_1214730 [compost metagenome]
MILEVTSFQVGLHVVVPLISRANYYREGVTIIKFSEAFGEVTGLAIDQLVTQLDFLTE